MPFLTDKLASLRTLFISNSVSSIPTDAAYNALTPTYSVMSLRRTFGSRRRAYNLGVIAARTGNAGPTVANAIPNQSVNESSAWNFQFASNTFADANSHTLTYTATLSSGAALPGWITFTAATRTFSGTSPSVVSNTTITIRVTATDPFGASVFDDFDLTINNV